MSPLDFHISKAILKVSLMERLLHDHGLWQIKCENTFVPAQVESNSDHILVKADFPEGVFGDNTDPKVSICLMHEGEIASVMMMENPGWDEFSVEWKFSAELVQVHH